jgi:hypothetical protein
MTPKHTDAELFQLWEERAAIMEVEGGLSREKAERLAYWCLRAEVGLDRPMPASISERIRKFGGSLRPSLDSAANRQAKVRCIQQLRWLAGV